MNPFERLSVDRHVAATPERVFEAWTSPEQIVRWWGGGGVTCPEAQVDLRPGGSYRIANASPDGTCVWISGVFQLIEPPSRLVYTWSVEPPGGLRSPDAASLVHVEFQLVEGGTRVSVTQSRIPDPGTHDLFEAGWNGCLDGLRDLFAH